jgi:hypothetical protein
LIWIQYANSRKEIRKNRKEKRRKQNKYIKGPGGNNLAQLQIEPVAQETFPELVPFSSSHLADSRGPRVSTDAFFHLQPETPPETVSSPLLLLPLIPL